MKIPFEYKFFNDLTVLELYKIIQLREKIFIVEQNDIYLDADDLDINAWHLQGFSGEKNLIAYARVIPPNEANENIRFGRVVVDSEYRKKGIATQLITEVMSRIQKSLFNYSKIQISAQLHLENFYATFGFQRVGDIYYEGHIPHIKMLCDSVNLSS